MDVADSLALMLQSCLHFLFPSWRAGNQNTRKIHIVFFSKENDFCCQSFSTEILPATSEKEWLLFLKAQGCLLESTFSFNCYLSCTFLFQCCNGLEPSLWILQLVPFFFQLLSWVCCNSCCFWPRPWPSTVDAAGLRFRTKQFMRSQALEQPLEND